MATIRETKWCWSFDGFFCCGVLFRSFDGIYCCGYKDKQRRMDFHRKETPVKPNVHFFPKFVSGNENRFFSNSLGVSLIYQNKIRR